MACLSPTATHSRLEVPAASVSWLIPRGWRNFWLSSRAEWRDRREGARLDHHALRDLGLHRDMIERPDPRGHLGQLWLSRPGL